ncbi:MULTISPECIES: NAD(P)/FAD-dependent oxidoreductase [unclassified Saccharicrinis]|uniref:NAD(P)/FAD-dependent oxidoreductase n=1 Tax=unclassified Saccharicrinis TaxID=2646859 RepID=UPI003D356A10
MKKILIVGAGTIGLHIAYYLRQNNYEVEVLEAAEKEDLSGCSYVNCGYTVPSHFITIASPSMLQTGLKMTLVNNGPVSFNLVKNLGHIGWFLRFSKAAINRAKVNDAIPLLYQLNYQSDKLYQELKHDHHWDNEYCSKGLLMVASTQKALHEEIELALLANNLGIKTKSMDAQALSESEGNIRFNATGGILYYSDAMLNPGMHMRALRDWLTKNGVVFNYGSRVSEILQKNGTVNAVKCGLHTFKADEFVLATGAGTSYLGKLLNMNLPVMPGKGYSIDFGKEVLPLNTPMILTNEKIAISPFADMVRIGSGMEFNGQLNRYDYKRIQGILDATKTVIPSFPYYRAHKLKLQQGLRPLTPDGIPIIGRTQKYGNLTVAAGHAMMGMSLAPITGQIVTEQIAGMKPSFNMDMLSPDRY